MATRDSTSKIKAEGRTSYKAHLVVRESEQLAGHYLIPGLRIQETISRRYTGFPRVSLGLPGAQ